MRIIRVHPGLDDRTRPWRPGPRPTGTGHGRAARRRGRVVVEGRGPDGL